MEGGSGSPAFITPGHNHPVTEHASHRSATFSGNKKENPSRPSFHHSFCSRRCLTECRSFSEPLRTRISQQFSPYTNINFAPSLFILDSMGVRTILIIFTRFCARKVTSAFFSMSYLISISIFLPGGLWDLFLRKKSDPAMASNAGK